MIWWYNTFIRNGFLDDILFYNNHIPIYINYIVYNSFRKSAIKNAFNAEIIHQSVIDDTLLTLMKTEN